MEGKGDGKTHKKDVVHDDLDMLLSRAVLEVEEPAEEAVSELQAQGIREAF